MKNLTPGMNYMKVEEICEILRTCKESGVTELSFRGLKVKLGHQASSYTHTVSTPQPVYEKIEAPQEIQKHELELREDELALLAIEDPLEYEAAVARGELENISSGGEYETKEY